MSHWIHEPIRSVVEEKETWNPHEDHRAKVQYLEISDIHSSSGQIISTRLIDVSDPPSRARRLIRKGDIVFGTTRPYLKNIAVVPETLDQQVCSTGFCVLRPNTERVMTQWLFNVCRSDLVVDQVIPGQEKHAYPAISDNAVLDSLIPIPPLAEQRRIVVRIEELTRRAEAARRLRQEAVAEISSGISQIRKKLFHSLSLSWPSRPLSKCGKVLGGGTPSRKREDYWNGHIPWIAPKEMKDYWISSSSERITEAALKESSAAMVPGCSVLFVVRGMILARYVPIAIATTPCAINQDMKAIVPSEGILAEYLAEMLWGANELLLAMVETAGHGTKKLETSRWSTLGIPVPDIATQQAVTNLLRGFGKKLSEVQHLQRETSKDLTVFHSALLAKAFRGEL